MGLVCGTISLLPLVGMVFIALSAMVFLIGLLLLVLGFIMKMPHVPIIGLHLPLAKKIYGIGFKLLVLWAAMLITAAILFGTPIAAKALKICP